MPKILLFENFTLSLPRLRAAIELWCNGNTADFGSVILSSNLGSSTRKDIPRGVFFLISDMKSRPKVMIV